MTAARLLRSLAVGLLLLNGSCAEEPSPSGGTATVVLGSPAGFESIKAGVPDGNLSATLQIGRDTPSSMQVNQATGVPSAEVQLPAGTHTFVIRYWVPHPNVPPPGLLQLAETSATATINANVQNQPVTNFTTLNTNFHNDTDGFTNLDETRARTNPTDSTSKPSGARKLAIGGGSNCVVVGDDDSVQCWGSNGFGQVGDNTFGPTADRPTPVYVVSESGSGKLINVNQVAVGGLFACALMNDTNRTVRCWGDTSAGRLGNPSATGEAWPRPIQVQNLSNVSALALGSGHACVIIGNDNSPGAVRCWGSNDRGQLGNGTSSGGANLIPQPTVPPITNARSLALGGEFSCAILSDDTVKCWGRNSSGQVGNGNRNGANVVNPTIVVSESGTGSLSTVDKVTAGGVHTCAVRRDTNLRCWGSNSNGQLNNLDVPKTTFTATPVFSGLNGTKEVLLGGELDSQPFTCALSNGDTIRCLGHNGNGQLGIGTASEADFPLGEPVQNISNGNTFGVVGAGKGHVCVLLDSTGVRCWGRGDKGQLGNGGTTKSPSPVQVTGFP